MRINMTDIMLLTVVLSCCVSVCHAKPARNRMLGMPTGSSGTWRSLLQTPNVQDCNMSVPFCNKCRYEFVAGTQTKAVCTECDVGYSVKKKGRACWCAPGFYRSDATSNTCSPCDENYWCPGAKLTIASGDARNKCGENKGTNTHYARAELECHALAGFGWAQPDAVECLIGYYNPGNNNRKCTRCPGGLTTVAKQTHVATGCVAPEGYYYMRGRAVACARGTYKADKGNTDCTPCPDGFTTMHGEVGQAVKSACNILLSGYAVAGSGSVDPGVTTGALCPEGSYRAGELTTDGVTLPVTCVPCGDGMSTMPNVTGATSPNDCLVIPGYGFNGDSTSTSPGTATKCGLSKYNTGWNREGCSSCGLGDLNTDQEGSTSPDDCYTPVGHGTNRTSNGVTLMAFPCPLNTYGRPNKTYGLVDAPCTKCPEHSRTNTTASVDGSACNTDPGYGWYESGVVECDYGYFNPGYNKAPCSWCGLGKNTTAKQSTSDTACQVDYGWTTDGVSGIKPCLRGYFKDTLGAGACTQCPNGTTTTITVAPTEQSDCDACLPGYGTASLNVDNPACTICGSGYYSPGFVMGGAACTPCPTPYGYTGKMVSPIGSTTSDECYPEFPGNSSTTLDNFQDWDIIYMPIATHYLEVQSSISSLAACQDGCSKSDTCQYYEWRADTGNCYFKVAASKIVNPTVDKLGNDDSFILFEVSTAVYACYMHDDTDTANAVGETLTILSSSSLTAAVAACDAAETCIGITHDNGDGATYRLFKGTKWEAAIGKVRVVGETLNAWIGLCGHCSSSGTASCSSSGVCTCKSGYSGTNCNIVGGAFSITLVNAGTDHTYDAIFEAAAARWSSIIKKDLADFANGGAADLSAGTMGTGFTYTGPVDDIVIFYKMEYIDGPYNVLGSAGPLYTRGSDKTPISGRMRFDTSDIGVTITGAQFVDVILHEMGHVLGIGTLWPNFGCVSGCTPGMGGDNYYLCPVANQKYQEVGCTGSIPVETIMGTGSGCAHWRESTLVNEIMTPVLDTGVGVTNPLSVITIGALEDIYGAGSVDYSTADSFSCPNTGARMAQQSEAAGPSYQLIAEGPIGVLAA